MVDYVISRTPQRYVISPRCDLTVWHVLHPPTLYTLGFGKIGTEMAHLRKVYETRS